MKKILQFTFVAFMLLSGTVFAQSANSDCQNRLKKAKRAYRELGAKKAQPMFDLIIRDCDKTTAAQARSWLQQQAEEQKRKEQQQAEDQSFTVNGVRFNMIKVEGGTFRMGATEEQGSDAWDYEKPVHSVTLSDYYIGQTEVTQQLWEAVMGSNPSYFKGNNQRPVEMVSWEDCQEFIEELNRLTGRNFRLPTEAEWEFAARGGNKSRGYKYSGSNTVGDVAWYDGNSGSETHAVATKQANELDLYDMSGNVWEWCSDWYGAYQSGSQRNPKGPSSGGSRVLRGGGRYYGARGVRVSYRNYYTPSFRFNYNGLRLAL